MPFMFNLTLPNSQTLLGDAEGHHLTILQAAWALDLHKISPFPKSGLICIILSWFQPQFASFEGDLQPQFAWIHPKESIISFLKQNNLNYSKIKQELFCFENKNRKHMSQKTNKFDISILTWFQYSLNISANISSNFKILYIFQQPTERAFRKWSLIFLRVL